MKKTAIVLIVIGFILFAAGVFVIYTGFQSQKSAENSLVFEKMVTAQVTGMKAVEPELRKNSNSMSGYDYVNERRYEVEFDVTDGSDKYSLIQSVPESIYDEYSSSLEKNIDIEFSLYRNGDGAAYLSLKDINGATEDYQSVQVTKEIAVRMIVGLLTAAVGFVLLTNGDKLRKKAASLL